MSDQVIISLIGGVIGLIGTIFTGVMVYFMAKLKSQADKTAVEVAKAAVEVGNVATKLESTTIVSDQKLNAIAKVADATHKLTNSNMGIQLRLTAGMARRVADLTGKSKDIHAADEADQLCKEHQTQQDKVDEKYPGGVPDSHTPPNYTDLEPK